MFIHSILLSILSMHTSIGARFKMRHKFLYVLFYYFRLCYIYNSPDVNSVKFQKISVRLLCQVSETSLLNAC